jgi:alcohol dehydrogenase
MKAAVYHGARDIRVENVPDPKIKDSMDVILRVTKSAICGSDLHFYRGRIPMDEGFVVGHEFMGVVEEVGKGVKLFKKGDRVVAPFWDSCGVCYFCKRNLPTSCVGGGGCFGFGKGFGNLWGGQAEYVRVPFADGTLERIPEGVSDEQAIFLGDIFSTGYSCAEYADIKPGDTVAVLGDGPLGLFATGSAKLFGPALIITVGHHNDRLKIAKKMGCDVPINSSKEDLNERIKELTDGRGVDAVLECVGGGETLTTAIQIVKPGGKIGFIGFYSEPVKVSMLDFYLKDLTLKGGVCPAKNYISRLMPLIENGKIDPTLVISHRLHLSQTGNGYELMDRRKNGAIKVVLNP